MSRYVRVEVGAHSLDAVAAALRRLDVPFERDRVRLILRGSLECHGDPVDLRIAAGVLDTVEDFGFVGAGQTLQLVCGELDRQQLCTALLEPLGRELAEHRVAQAAHQAGLEIERVVDEHGVRRILVRRS